MKIFEPSLIEFCKDMNRSYQKFTKSNLLQKTENDLINDLYAANFILVAHKISSDPVFCFANLEAQKLWEMDWDEFTQTPSRLSAPEEARSERQMLLDAASERNIILDYNGVRISKSGRLFRIKDVTLWNIFDKDQALIGQAARFDPAIIEYIQ